MEYLAIYIIVLVSMLLAVVILYPAWKAEREHDRRRSQATYHEARFKESDIEQDTELTPRERAIIRSNLVKHQKRRARQRKAQRRNSK